jgi:RNA polymerase sigma factor
MDDLSLTTGGLSPQALSPEDLIDHLRDGMDDARDILIRTYWDYIMSASARMTGKRSDATDEFSVALHAFNEAIDSYNRGKRTSFLSFAGLVINRRLIGHFRKNKRYQSEYPFSSLAPEDNAEDIAGTIPDRIPLSEKFEIQEEILLFKKELHEYGITFDSLLYSAPKHNDTRQLCQKVALCLFENAVLSKKLTTDKKLPITQILPSFSLSRKTLENNRQYIIALFLILKSDLDILKGYIESSVKGGQK